MNNERSTRTTPEKDTSASGSFHYLPLSVSFTAAVSKLKAALPFFGRTESEAGNSGLGSIDAEDSDQDIYLDGKSPPTSNSSSETETASFPPSRPQIHESERNGINEKRTKGSLKLASPKTLNLENNKREQHRKNVSWKTGKIHFASFQEKSSKDSQQQHISIKRSKSSVFPQRSSAYQENGGDETLFRAHERGSDSAIEAASLSRLSLEETDEIVECEKFEFEENRASRRSLEPRGLISKPGTSFSNEYEFEACFYSRYHKDPCFLTGIAVLEDHQIVICDFVHGILQYFSSDFVLLDKQKCPEPWGVCPVSKNSFAVSQYSMCKVQMFSIENNRVKKTQTVKVGNNTFLYDLKFASNRLFVSCQGGIVIVTDLLGNQIEVIEPKEAMDRMCFLAIDDVNDHTIISGGESVVCMNKRGETVWRFPEVTSNMKIAPRGVAISRRRIFVADSLNNQVLSVSTKNGRYLGVVAKGNIECPQSVAVSADRRGLYLVRLSHDASESRNIRVFRLSDS